MSTRFVVSCECGFTSSARSAAYAARSLRAHSCERARAQAAATARARAREAAVDRTPAECIHPRARHQHGTYAAYVWDRCRCVPCSAANAAYEQTRSRQAAYGHRPYVPTDEAVAHLQALRAAGLGSKRAAGLAGVPVSTVGAMLWGQPDRGRGPRRKARQSTVEKILAVPVPTLDDLGATIVVDSTGTSRRLQALMARGWSVARVASTRGLDRQPLDRALRGGLISAATARAVTAAYEALWDQPPPASARGDRVSAGRALARATAAGWPPPLAWDDDTIDDPHATPAIDPDPDPTPGIDDVAVAVAMAGDRVRLTRAERWDAVERLARAGLDDNQIADRLHVTARTVLRVRRTLGISSPRRTAAGGDGRG